MIKTLEIQNFKSIKHLKLDCKRINIFIGEPNTGKSNILECLGIFSLGGYGSYAGLSDFIRFERMSNLFHDENTDEAVMIRLEDITFDLAFKGGNFAGRWHKGGAPIAGFQSGHSGPGSWSPTEEGKKSLCAFKSYRFTIRREFPRPETDFLLPPYGDNLMSLFLAHKELRSIPNQVFSRFGLKLVLRPQENKMEIVKHLEDVIVSYPYSLASDTLQRVVFYLTAVNSNRDSVLVFEEPESHAFPYHTKYLAETIALSANNNQFFISTHNPYFLFPIVEKAPKEDVAVFITYYEDYQTKVRPLTEEQLGEIAEVDVFSNLDRFLGAE